MATPKKNCLEGCTCGRHDGKKCPPGCTCKRHQYKSCPDGCTCYRHRVPHNKYTDEQRAEARDLRLAKNREYMRNKRAQDPEWAREQRRKSYATHGRKHFLKWKFGLTLEQRAQILEDQDHCCYLCSLPLANSHGLPVHIDHDRSCCPGDRSCGKCIRGIAHQKCNQGIGQFNDDPVLMRRVADALEAAQERLKRS